MGRRSREAGGTPGPTGWHRRGILALVAGVGGLAGCSSSDDGGGTEIEDRTAEQVSTGTGGSSPASSVTGSRMYRVDAANSGHLSEERGPGEEPVEKWSEFMTTIRFITPAVVDGTVHVGPELSAADGSTLWDGDFYERSPAVADRYLYSVIYGELNAVSLDDTLNEWNYAFASNPSAPTVVGDIAYIGHDRGRLFALTTPGEADEGFQEDGEEVWSFQQPDDPESGLETGAFNTPAVVGDTVYAASPNHLYALDAADGSQRWVQTDVTGGVPAVVDGTIYLPRGDAIVARSVVDGTKEWESEVGSPHPVAVANGAVYANDGTLHALDTTDGSVLWQTELPGEAATPVGMPTSEDLPSTMQSFEFSAPPVVADGTVYATNGGTITAVAAGTGAIQWSYETTGTGAWTPAVADGELYVVVSESGPTESDNYGHVLALTEP